MFFLVLVGVSFLFKGRFIGNSFVISIFLCLYFWFVIFGVGGVVIGGGFFEENDCDSLFVFMLDLFMEF